MSFDWSEYLDLAWELHGKSKKKATQEAKQRSAISRAYYAAFRKARDYLKNKEGYIPVGTDSSHWDVIEQFKKNPADEKRKNIAEMLDALRRERNRADYDARLPDVTGVAKMALPLAEKIIKELESLN